MSNPLQKLINQSGTPDEIYQHCWEKHGFKTTRQEGGSEVTAPVQRVIDPENPEKTEEQVKRVKNNADGDVQFKNKAVKAAVDMNTKTMDATEVENFTPLIFDPEIVSLVRDEAPVFDRIAKEGQEGFSAVFNVIDSRDDPIGNTNESDAIDLLNNASSDIQFAKDSVDMEIYVDLVNISDFSQEGAAHYMNVEDTTLGSKMGQYAQRSAQQVFYGDPSQSTGTGYIGDEDGFAGLKKIAEDAGNDIDKSSVTSEYIKDIKNEVRQLRQDESVNVSDLLIATSHEFFDVLENEADFDNLRTDPSDQTVNVGLNNLSIAGVPVVPTHNVDEFTDDTYTAGDPGDVFIMSTRAVRYRQLMPVSMVPLAKTGLSENAAIAEFRALIDKSQGSHLRHLQSYDF